MASNFQHCIGSLDNGGVPAVPLLALQPEPPQGGAAVRSLPSTSKLVQAEWRPEHTGVYV